MAIQLKKATVGSKINLSKVSQEEGGKTLQKLEIALGWNENPSVSGQAFDLDASIAFVDNAGKCPGENDFLFYNTPNLSIGYATHSGDNLTGEGEGDDEVINVDLTKVPTTLEKGEIFVTIHEAVSRGQNFGMMDNAFVEVRDGDTKEPIARLDLDFDADVDTSIKFGAIQRRGNEWYFVAQKEGLEGGLEGIVSRIGLQ